jgi:hypothetical protein
MNQDAIDRDNAGFYERTAAEEFAKGNICWGLYFLDAADFYAESSPEAAAARMVLLQQAMEKLGERTEQW